jgi:bifunctional DNA-binding transcriptional regulator/antitoxin component of YhaV-PrlF toxin-antitoxin module
MPLGLLRKALGLDSPLTIGRKGTLALPSDILTRFGLEPGAAVILEETERGILIRPAERTTWETYTPRRKAEFLLNTALPGPDLETAKNLIREMGVVPETIPGADPAVAIEPLSEHMQPRRAAAAA